MTSFLVTVHGFKGFPLTAGFKGCILITIRHFVNVFTGKPTASTSPQTCPPLPTSWDMPVPYMTGEAGGSGTWYLAIMWENKHF